MFRTEKERINRIALLTLVIGIVLTALSAINGSSFLAVLGVSVAFWSILLFYLGPAKRVSLALFNASAGGGNTERSLLEFDSTEKGIYLPPRNLPNCEDSLIFVPKVPQEALPAPEKTSGKLFNEEKTGLFLTPPGFALSVMFEHALGLSFTKIELSEMQTMIMKLVHKFEFAKDAQVRIQDNIITLELTDCSFNTICQETANSQPRTHTQVGCVLASAFACAFAKASGKPIIIQEDMVNPVNKALTVKYRMEET
jgi:hypothetical protein